MYKSTILNKQLSFRKKVTNSKIFKEFWQDRYLLLLLLPMIIYLIIFSYIPMYGILISFQNYRIGNKFVSFSGGTEWVGLRHFIYFFKSIFFERVMRNAILNSTLGIAFGFWVPIGFAILLNEIRHKTYKKIVQTLSYLPHFISTVIIVGIIINMLATTDGVINNFIEMFGGERIEFLNESQYFRPIYILSGIWQSFGWSSILYMAAIAGIDQSLYEAARIDGADRWRQIVHITIPGIMPTITLLLILSVGSILNSDTEKILLLYNPATYDVADVIGTYTYRVGLVEGQYSYAAAIGLFSTVVNFALLTISNKVTRRVSDYSIW